MWNGGTNAAHCPYQIEIDDALPELIICLIKRWLCAIPTSGVNQHIHRSELLDAGGNRSINRFGVSNIAMNHERYSTVSIELARDFVGRVIINVRDGDQRAFLHKAFGSRPANPMSTPCDEYRPSGKSLHEIPPGYLAGTIHAVPGQVTRIQYCLPGQHTLPYRCTIPT
jgi:hypothetical protein